jgi:hypothetical protein
MFCDFFIIFLFLKYDVNVALKSYEQNKPIKHIGRHLEGH